ncbi:MAG TPA: aminotransferase class I/II-fold pyridoxal phosphate-dependent enzyme [Acidimicrobiales bacterium]|nr:aminotransferase class I/II-fold pyridoxal phosphate-dependent enzyme [Acidimicrobiales bacterium]
MTAEHNDQPDTIAVTAGRGANGRSMATPLWASSTFEMESVDASQRAATSPKAPEFYSRYGNPTVNAFEDAVAQLEGAEQAQAFASGMGAITTLVLAMCSQGDHIVAQHQTFSTTQLLFGPVCARFGIEATIVDGTDTDAIAAAIRPNQTRLLFVETPANPLLQLVDLDAVGSLQGPIKVCDSTFAGPMITRPLEHGFDLVMHSATKSLAGHNDATLGVVAGERDLISWIWSYHTIHGATASPFDALNGLRGIRTLGVRVRQQSATAQHVAEQLEGHPKIRRVHYPGLDSHPQRDLAKRQMAMGGGVLSFEVDGGWDAGRTVAEALRLAHLAPSLGGPETLVTHVASTTAANLTPEEREAMGIDDGLLRLSVGLEDPADLVADLQQALDRV